MFLLFLLFVARALPASAQVINTGTLFITTDETVFIDDDFIVDHGTDQAVNQGRLMVTGTMQFASGVIDEVGGSLSGGWLGQPGTPLEEPNFHTIFLDGAQSAGAAARTDEGAYDSLIDGPVRRSGGGDFIFPTGDVRDQVTYRGLLAMAAQDGNGDLDVEYFWRNGLDDFGQSLGPRLRAVSDKEYWRAWGQHPVTLSAFYESSSMIEALISSVPGARLSDLTLVGWDGQEWLDLDGQPAGTATPGGGFVQARVPLPRQFLALTFGIRIRDRDSDGDGLSDEAEWDADGDGQGPDDTDGDGTVNILDADDDGDGYPTADEDWNQTGTPADDDANKDGTPDYLDPLAPSNLRLWVSKKASTTSLGIADPVIWQLSVENRSDVVLTTALVDIMPLGLAFNPERLADQTGAKVGLPPAEAMADVAHPDVRPLGLFIHWPGLRLAPGEKRVIEFGTETTIGMDPGLYQNQAYAYAGSAKSRFFSNLAEQAIEVQPDQQLECAAVIGRVFDDLNADGYYDAGEPGLPQARIGGQSGLSLVTDDRGRFHLPCELSPTAWGKNLILKLDTRTLPEGYKVTSENPRAIRVTRGKMTKLAFATTKQREIQLDFDDCNFMIPSNAPVHASSLAVLNPVWEQRMEPLIKLLEERPARLIISYTGGPSMTNRLIQSRVRQAQHAILSAWKAKRRPYPLRTSIQVQRYIRQEAPPCEPSFLAGIVGLNVIDALPPNTRPLTPEELERLHLEPGFTAVQAPDGRKYLLETKGAAGSKPTQRSDHQLPPGSQRIDDPLSFGLKSVPEGLIPYLTPSGSLRLIKPTGSAPSFVPAKANPG